MEDKIKQEAIKEVEEQWENNLKKNFEIKLNNCFQESLKNVEKEMKKFDELMNSHIKTLNENFEKKFEMQINQLRQQSGIKLDKGGEILVKEDKENVINNIPVETDDTLRKMIFYFNNVTNPPLKNIIPPPGSNPLINLILNFLTNVKTTVFYYLNPGKEEKIMGKSKDNPNILGPAFLKLLDHCWKSKLNEYSPTDFHQILKNLMKNDYYTLNPGKIFEFILSKLHSELSPDELINNNNMENDPYMIFNREKMLEELKKRFQHPTKISNGFYNIIETEKRCITCESISYLIENLPIINIYLEANEDSGFNHISFMEHFQALLTGKNEGRLKEECKICEKQTDKLVSKTIVDTTEVIIININRNNDPNHVVEFKFPEKFDKKDIINTDKTPNYFDMNYELISVMRKNKVNNNNYQFLLFCKNFINHTWYSYNNQNIQKSDYNEAISDGKNTCLIIYKKIQQQK